MTTGCASTIRCVGVRLRRLTGRPVPVPLPAGRHRRRRPRADPRCSPGGHSASRRGAEANPFLRYRALMHSYHVAVARGPARRRATATWWRRSTRRSPHVDGHGFRATPFFRSRELSEALAFSATGGVWVKDETGNVSGLAQGPAPDGRAHPPGGHGGGRAPRPGRPPRPGHRQLRQRGAGGGRGGPGRRLAADRVRPARRRPGLVARLRDLQANVVDLPARARRPRRPGVPAAAGGTGAAGRCRSPPRAPRTGWPSRAARRWATSW